MSKYDPRHSNSFAITFEQAARKYAGFNDFSIRLGLQPVRGNYFCEMWNQQNRLVNTKPLLVPEAVYMLIQKKTFSGNELRDAMKEYEKKQPISSA